MGWVFTDETRFYLHDNETLLDGMIRTEHKMVRYECRQGYCGVCKMRLAVNTGEVSYIYPPLVVLADDEVLACCCRLSGTVCVSYEAVEYDEQPSAYLKRLLFK